MKTMVNFNTSFLVNQEDIERSGYEYDTLWNPDFVKGIKSNYVNFKSSGKKVIPASKTKFFMVDFDGEEMPYTNVEFKKGIDGIFIDLDDYDPDEFGVSKDNTDKFEEIIRSKPDPTLNDVIELIDLENEDLSFYGCYVNEVKVEEIISITLENPNN